MESLHNRILALDKQTAIYVLQTFAKAQLRTGNYQDEITRDLRKRLVDEFETLEPLAVSPDEGDLARQSLLLIVEKPQYVEAIDALLENPTVGKFFVDAETVAIVVAAFVALQTHVRFERGKEGSWSIKIEKKSTSDTLMKPLVQKLLAFIGNSST